MSSSNGTIQQLWWVGVSVTYPSQDNCTPFNMVPHSVVCAALLPFHRAIWWSHPGCAWVSSSTRQERHPQRLQHRRPASGQCHRWGSRVAAAAGSSVREGHQLR